MLILLIIIIFFVFYFKRSKEQAKQEKYERFKDELRKSERWDRSRIVNRHYELLEAWQALYSKVYQSGNYRSPDAYRFEALCLEDISIAEEFIKICKACDQDIPSYPVFKQLAIFYEKQGNYQLAIPLCDEAIRLGFTDDGTKEGMQGRLERLEKKYNGK